ncbi:hypothetical protein Acry_1566 [Acidiphilium cryptum JF-5]|uniref:Uncharacterized protein n=1 Tax=Acidiphilium cryptum (strain JF-5) TaxID=349163 RepID=A5FYU0_ACICJ|nr:hypothetical protein Acry_1566 [Acidiphilium cryptum JF-5]
MMGGLIGAASGMRAVPVRHGCAGVARDQCRNHDEPDGQPHFSGTDSRLAAASRRDAGRLGVGGVHRGFLTDSRGGVMKFP